LEFQSLNPIFPARDLHETQAFYEAIGFKTADLFEDFGYLIMYRDKAEVHFFHHKDLDPATNNHAGYLRMPEVDRLSDHLATLGLPSEGIPRWSPAEDTPWNMRETIWVDPNGTLIRAGAFPENG
jgi:catechol 2,3-dioxygenase-like lactoylglutathione lyase family enzyme